MPDVWNRCHWLQAGRHVPVVLLQGVIQSVYWDYWDKSRWIGGNTQSFRVFFQKAQVFLSSAIHFYFRAMPGYGLASCCRTRQLPKQTHVVKNAGLPEISDHWSALWCCPHPGGNSARTASCENVDFARGGRQIKVSRAFISWFMRWHKLHHCYAPSLLRTVVTRTWSYLYFRGCKFGLLITFADYERGMGWEHWMHFSSRLRMQSVFFFAQGQLASLKQSSPGLREQLRDRLQSVMQADRIPLSTHVPSSLLPLQQDVAEFLKSQVILPFCLSKETVTRQRLIPRR